MAGRIKVKVLKETTNNVTLFFPTLNRRLPVAKSEFKKRVDKGLYEVLNKEEITIDE